MTSYKFSCRQKAPYAFGDTKEKMIVLLKNIVFSPYRLLMRNRSTYCTSFPPIVGGKPHLLILGSMPGERSLAVRQYYGHPQNSFWRIMGELCGAGHERSYEERLEALKRSGIALWDVLKHCEREGSGDGNIRPGSEVPNAIGELLAAYPTIRAVALNGSKARQAFRRHIWPHIPETIKKCLTIVELPSTSPACARIPFSQKSHRWCAALKPFVRGTQT